MLVSVREHFTALLRRRSLSKTIRITCDCGCGSSSDSEAGWFVIAQPLRIQNGDEAKLERELHFIALCCLKQWAEAAEKAFPELQTAARGLSPRGRMIDKMEVGLYG